MTLMVTGSAMGFVYLRLMPMWMAYLILHQYASLLVAMLKAAGTMHFAPPMGRSVTTSLETVVLMFVLEAAIKDGLT